MLTVVHYVDISLNVKGCSDIISSLRKYTEPEKMDGDNMYKTESHGLQPAQKGILFDSFPPVLHLHLKRFEYDYVKQQYIKVNDKFIFQPMLNLAEFVSPDADKSGDYIYHLHGFVVGTSNMIWVLIVSKGFFFGSVLVHSGTVGSGHYYAFLRPGEGPQWYKFDDTTVVKVSTQRAIDDNFGGAEISLLSGNKVTTQSSKNSSACTYAFNVW
jgi:ubiquitin carboxyl-terminal hydrolase 7